MNELEAHALNWANVKNIHLHEKKSQKHTQNLCWQGSKTSLTQAVDHHYFKNM